MARCIFHIDLDVFFVSVEQVLNSELRGKPVIVGGDPERRIRGSADEETRVPFFKVVRDFLCEYRLVFHIYSKLVAHPSTRA